MFCGPNRYKRSNLISTQTWASNPYVWAWRYHHHHHHHVEDNGSGTLGTGNFGNFRPRFSLCIAELIGRAVKVGIYTYKEARALQMATASSASLFQAARYGYSPSPRFSNNCNFNVRSGGVAVGVGSSSSASSPSSSSHHGLNFSSSGWYFFLPF